MGSTMHSYWILVALLLPLMSTLSPSPLRLFFLGAGLIGVDRLPAAGGQGIRRFTPILKERIFVKRPPLFNTSGAFCFIICIRQARFGGHFKTPGFYDKIDCIGLFFMAPSSYAVSAGASTATWQDVWTDPDGSVLLNAEHWYYSYTHDITDNGFDVGQDLVTSYDLSIGLYDDSDCDRSEWAWIDLPGLVTDGIFKIDYEDIQRGWSIAGLISLNTTGTLGVEITRLAGDFYFGESTLNAYGCEANPVPLPASAILLGTGLVGLIGFRRRTAKISD